jgi:tetratricopeptide (TPR) repeat protein
LLLFMTSAQNRLLSIWQDAPAKCFLWALVWLCFFVYPLAVFPPVLKVGQTVLFNLTHTISVPGTVLLGLLAVPVLLFLDWRLGRLFLWALIIFVIMLLVNIPGEMEYLDEFVILIGYVTIPLASAVLLAHGYVSFKKMAVWASVLWGLQILLGSLSLYRQMEPVGTPGNINWMAGLLLLLSPWVIWYFYQFTHRKIPNRIAAMVLAVSAWLAPTLFILYHCHSRSAWLALCLFPPAMVMIRLRRLVHKALVLGLLALIGLGCMLSAYIYFPVRLLQVMETDVRVPLWTGTAVMIAKHPLGVGAGTYQEAFAPLRRVSSYQNRLFAADMTVHPHNEILNVGAQLGIPAMLAFCVMLAAVFRHAVFDPLQMCARMSAFFAVMLSMFDMLLVQPPTSFMGFFFMGLCWPVSKPGPPVKDRVRSWVAPKILVSALVIIAMLIFGILDLSHDFHMRQGELAESKAYSHMDANAPDKGQAYLGAAISHFQEGAIPFSQRIPYYKIGRLSLMLPEKADQAQTYLDRVAAGDPNFSHLNLLYGQLYLKKGDLAAAEMYFSRECEFYPRSERAWQNMYTFATAAGLYTRLDPIDTLLGDIYRERARQNFGDQGLSSRQIDFGKHVFHENPTRALAVANALVDRINHNFTDPLLMELTRGQPWPATFFKDGFNVMDAAGWRLRYTLFSDLHKEFGSLPVDPVELVSWYTGTISIQGSDPSTFPLGVWNQRGGSVLPAYLLFSMVCELNQYASIICTDAMGQPSHAFVFVKQSQSGQPLLENSEKSEMNHHGFKIFRVDLMSAICKPVSWVNFNADFEWKIGRTLVYYPVTDYFLRNQILGAITKEETPWLPRHPPSKRLLDLFAITRSAPPSPSLLRHFCYDGHIRQHLARIHALQSDLGK